MGDSIENIAKNEEQNNNLLFYNFNASGRDQDMNMAIPRPSERDGSSRASKFYMPNAENSFDEEMIKDVSTVRTSHENITAEQKKHSWLTQTTMTKTSATLAASSLGFEAQDCKNSGNKSRQ
jgi:hypothetical protein